jgi:chromosome segregation ATPase
MTDAQPNVRQRTVSVDELFSRLHDDRVDYTIGLPNPTGPEGQRAPDAMPAYAEVQAPPTLETAADLQVAQEWLQAERQRLEAYTRSQFAAIQQQHQSLLAKQFRSEEALALRAQELNREMKFLASQAEALQSRAHQLAEREAALTVQVDRLATAEQELLTTEQTGNKAWEEVQAHRTILERLHADLAQLRAAGADASTDAAAFEAALKERQQAWEQKQGDLVVRQEQMEQRYLALENAEEASQRRLEELNELEDLLRHEFEQQESRLVQERREIDVLRTRLRMQIRKLEEGLDETEEDAVPI